MRKIILGLSILSIILTAGVTVVEASNNTSSWKETIKEKIAEFRAMAPEEKKEQMEEAKRAIEELQASDEWQNATPEERKELMQTMAEEKGIFPLRGKGRAFGGEEPNKGEFAEHHQAVIDALEAGDYEAWLEATEGKGPAEKVTEETFSKLVEAHNLMKAGDKEGSKEIMKELGLNRSPKAIKAFGKGFKKGFEECQNNTDSE